MGCGESTGKSDGGAANTKIEFKEVGCASIDKLFNEAKDLVEKLTSFQSSLEDQKANFFETTGFEFVPGARPKHAFTGMFMSFSAMAAGDVSALKADWKADAPFAFVDVSNLGEEATSMYESFVGYAKALEDIVGKLPDCLDQAQKIVDQADSVQSKAEKELDELDIMKKAKAVMFTGKNVMAASKLPKAVQESIDSTKSEIQLLKDAVDEMKANFPKLGEQGKTCSEKEITAAPKCYVEINGKVPCSDEEREEWAKNMTAVMEKRKKPFKPEDYY